MPKIELLGSLGSAQFETPKVLKAVGAASRQLAELKGAALSIPNQAVLINSLSLQEAKDSSAVENIVTTHDELFRDDAFPTASGAAAKEVLRYRQALNVGFESVKRTGLLTIKQIVEVHEALEGTTGGFRKLPGTVLKDGDGRVVYTPPQDPAIVVTLMGDLERFMNDDSTFDADPLIKMAIAHHQFESIHPFYDGNGRTGRILNVLYLVRCGLLDIPVLYLSRHVVRTKAEYYRLLQHVRERAAWEEWVMYMLSAVEQTARATIITITAISTAMLETKRRIRTQYKFYSQDLINTLFMHPYTKIQFIQRDLGVSRLTATKYLDALAAGGVLRKVKIGRSSYYLNVGLVEILTGNSMISGAE